MDVESCQFFWEVPFISRHLIYKSPIFSRGGSVLNWDILYDAQDLYNHGFVLRARTAPFGEIDVTFSAQIGFSDMSKARNDIDNIGYVAEKTFRAYKENFCFQNYGSNASDADIISKHEFSMTQPQHYVHSIRIRITCTIRRQPKFQELCLANSEQVNSGSTKSIYAEELMRAVQTDHEFCDVKILVHGTQFKAHRNILAAVSPVFRAAMTNNMLEKNSGCIKIEDFDTEVVRKMMEFIYKGCVKFSHYREAIDLSRLADIYDIQHLQIFCTSYLEQQMNPNNVLEIFTTAEITNSDTLSEMALNYFAKNPKAYKADDFKDILKFKPEKLPVLLEKLSSSLSKGT